MLRRLIYPHSLIVTCLMFVLIWFLDMVRINFHFLNPFNESIRDYEISDIVYSRLKSRKISPDNRIVLVHWDPQTREVLYKIVDRIVDAGAKVIALDIKLYERKDPHIDSLLRKSLLRSENTVLANELSDLSEDGKYFRSQIECDTFFSNYINTGFINFVNPDSSTVRYFAPRESTQEEECLSFAVRTAAMYAPEAVERLFKRNKEIEEIYYTGDENQFVQFDAQGILDPAHDLRAALKDKIVLIGFIPIDPLNKPMIDIHYTPLNYRYTGHNTPDMYGVVIHANIIRMILDYTYVNEVSFWVNLLLTFIFCYLNIHLFYKIFRYVSVPYQFVTRFLQLGEIILLFFIVALLFHFYRVKMDVAYWITALLLTFDAVKFYDNGLRKRIPLLSKIPYELPAPVKQIKKTEKVVEKPIEETPSTENNASAEQTSKQTKP